MFCYENQGVTDLPPLQESRPRNSQTRRGKEYENWTWGSLHVLILLVFPSGASLNLEVLNGVASCMTSCLVHVAIGVSRIGHIGQEVDGSVIDVLVETRLVRKLETFSEWCYVEKCCAQWVTQVVTLAGSCLFFVLQ